MSFKLKQIALTGLLACLGVSATAANYFFVQPKSMEMPKAPLLNVSLSPVALPESVVGLPYNGGSGFDLKSVLSVTGDPLFNPGSTTFAVTAGTLPAGLTLSATGLLSGTPTVASAGSIIQVKATYKTASGVQTYQAIALNLTVTLAAASLPQATVGTLYNLTGYDFKQQLAVTGDANYAVGQATFKLADGSTLPTGLALSSTGVLAGTPTTATAGAVFTVQADYKTKNSQKAYTLVVAGPSQTLSAPFTVEAWVRIVPTSTGGAMFMAVGDYFNGENWGGTLSQTTLAYNGSHIGINNLYGIQGQLSLYSFTAAAPVDKGVWNHIAVEVRSDNVVSIALNGIFVWSQQYAAQISPAAGILRPTFGGTVGFSVANDVFWSAKSNIRDSKVVAGLKYSGQSFDAGLPPSAP